jgi:hypothetical protein
VGKGCSKGLTRVLTKPWPLVDQGVSLGFVGDVFEVMAQVDRRLTKVNTVDLLNRVNNSSWKPGASQSWCWRMKARKTEGWPNMRPCAWAPRTGPRGRLGLHPHTHDARGGAPFAGRPSLRGCTPFISQSHVSFTTWVLFYI